MKIAFTGGGSGGHFYPLIAVAEEVRGIVEKHGLMEPELHYFANSPYDEMLLYQNEMTFHFVPAGKRRLYGSLSNVIDFLKIFLGVPSALHALYKVYPDVLFSKGGYPSVPVVFAAHLLRIPIVIHDSDAVPGRANLWAAKYAQYIAVGYPEAVAYFKGYAEKVACVGNPVRKEVRIAVSHEPHTFFNFVPNLPTVFVVGGSQGAEHLNNTLLQAISELLSFCQVIHQTGKANYESYKELVDVALKGHAHPERYRLFPYMQPLDIINAAGAATIVVSRAGSGSVFELAEWAKPAILVPIPESVSRDQRENAYAYARAGACEVVEQHNCTPHVLVAEIRRILEDKAVQEKMIAGAKKFRRPEAAKTIAERLVAIALKHEL